MFQSKTEHVTAFLVAKTERQKNSFYPRQSGSKMNGQQLISADFTAVTLKHSLYDVYTDTNDNENAF